MPVVYFPSLCHSMMQCMSKLSGMYVRLHGTALHIIHVNFFSLSVTTPLPTMNVVCVSTCMLGWTFLYAWLCYMLPYKSCEWNCRLVTVIHAVFVMVIAGWSMFIQGPNPLVDTGITIIHPLLQVSCLLRVQCIALVATARFY